VANNVSVKVDTGAFLTIGLFFIFLILKLTGHITWSWWWITIPLWGPITAIVAAVLAFILVVLLGGFLVGLVRAIIGRKK